MKALQRGENAAWRQAYLKYKDDLLTVARSLVCDIDAAEDCLQEVFVSVAADGCKVRSNLKGYLLSCVVNRARDHLRRRYAQSNWQVNMRTRRADVRDPANIVAEDEQAKTVTRCWRNCPSNSGKSSPCICRVA